MSGRGPAKQYVSSETRRIVNDGAIGYGMSRPKGGKTSGNVFTKGCISLSKIMSRYYRRDAGLEREKLRETVDPEGSFIIGSRFFPNRLALHLSLPEE
jgi:hypothetical protein